MSDKYKHGHGPRFDNLWRLIGNTPMIVLYYRYRGGPQQRVFVKCEQYNLTGSIKDRMALYILQKAYEEGQITAGDLIVEATSGNTGIALAAIGRALGHKVRIIMPDWMSHERKQILKAYGAELQLVSREAGGFLKSIALAEEMGGHEGVFLPRQFENLYNAQAHERTTGREIGHQLLLQEVRPDAFVAGVGTGGTVMGVGEYLRMLYPDIAIHPLEPAESPTLSAGYKNGSHRIQGISDEFIPAIVDLKQLDKVVQVSDGDAVVMAQMLSTELGIGVGISSGANLLGAVKLQQQIGLGSTVVTVFPDDNKKYVSTDLFRAEPRLTGALARDIELLHYDTLDRIK